MPDENNQQTFGLPANGVPAPQVSATAPVSQPAPVTPAPAPIPAPIQPATTIVPPPKPKSSPAGNIQLIESKSLSGTYEFEASKSTPAREEKPAVSEEQSSESSSEPVPESNAFPLSAVRPAASPKETGEPSSEPYEGDIAYIFKLVLKVLKKKIVSFLILTVAYALLMVGIQQISIPLMLYAMVQFGLAGIWVTVLMIGLYFFISYLFFGAMANQASAGYNSLSVNAGQSLLSTLKKTGKTLILGFRLFFYTRLWLLIFIPIIFTGVKMYVEGVSFDGISALGSQILEGGTEEINRVFINQGIKGGFTIMLTVLGLSVFAMLVVFASMIRSVRASLAFPRLMSNDFITSKDAIEYSDKYAGGKWWLIMSYSTCYGLMIAVLPMAVAMAASMTKISALGTVSFWISTIFGLLAIPLSIVFAQVLMHELGSQTTRYHATPLLVILTILIYLTPPLVTGDAASFVTKNLSALQTNIKSDDQPLFEFSSTQQGVVSDLAQDATTQVSSEQTEPSLTQAPETQQTQVKKPSVKVKRK